MYKKILVPVDGSHTSKLGLNEAIRLAKHHKARLRLIHVVDVFIVTPALDSGRHVVDMQKSFRDYGRKILERAEALVRKHDLVGLEDDLVNSFIEHIGISRERFHEVLERFRNRAIWRRSAEGAWEIPGHLQD